MAIQQDKPEQLIRIAQSIQIISRIQMKSWARKALETVNCYAFLKRRLIGAC
jgi:hypothetical protein